MPSTWDRVRRQEHKILKAAGDDRLKGTRDDWLRHPAAMEPKDRNEFKELRDSNLKTARAWALKQPAMAFSSYHYERPARKHFRWWSNWAARSRPQPMIEVAARLKGRFENIITYLRHRITNAASVSINAKWIKYTTFVRDVRTCPHHVRSLVDGSGAEHEAVVRLNFAAIAPCHTNPSSTSVLPRAVISCRSAEPPTTAAFGHQRQLSRGPGVSGWSYNQRDEPGNRRHNFSSS